ncbi:MAG: hypothetical protein J6C46_09715 [Clostridia bacterium]|nr:hypothetical protein [Clostridia bacterium]
MFNMAKIFETLGVNQSSYSYYFYLADCERNFLFISKNPIPFENFDNNLTNANANSSKACIEKGLLYDMTNNCFVLTKAEDCRDYEKWPNFFIYDGGIPHVIVTEVDNMDFYKVIYWDTKRCKYACTSMFTQPAYFISHVNPTSNDKASRYRIIFANFSNAHLKNDGLMHSCKSHFDTEKVPHISVNESMLVLDNDLSLIKHEKSIRYEDIIYFDSKQTSAGLAYKTLYPTETCLRKLSSSNEIDVPFVIHTFKGDVLVTKTYKSELGEYLLIFLDNTFRINYSLSCFSYTKFEETAEFQKYKYAAEFFRNNPFLIVSCRRNDFENISYAINLKTYDLLNYDTFLSNLDKIICQ